MRLSRTLDISRSCPAGGDETSKEVVCRLVCTIYSTVRPDGSFTPPANIDMEVLGNCGVLVRVLAEVDGPDLRIVVPRSQLFRWAMSEYSVIEAEVYR